MKEGANYVKRMQHDYTLILKLNVVKEFESGALSTLLKPAIDLSSKHETRLFVSLENMISFFG